MAKMKIEVEVSKETHEIGMAVNGLLKSVMDKKADGLSAAEIAVAATENIQKLLIAVEGAEKVGLEAQEDLAASIQAIGVMVAEAVGMLKPKQVAPVSGAV